MTPEQKGIYERLGWEYKWKYYDLPERSMTKEEENERRLKGEGFLHALQLVMEEIDLSSRTKPNSPL